MFNHVDTYLVEWCWQDYGYWNKGSELGDEDVENRILHQLWEKAKVSICVRTIFIVNHKGFGGLLGFVLSSQVFIE